MCTLGGTPLRYAIRTPLRAATNNLQWGFLGGVLSNQLGETLGALQGGIAGTLLSWSPRENALEPKQNQPVDIIL